MKIDAKSALLQPLLDDIRAISLKHQTLLSSFSLKISLKSTLSNHDQVVDILVSEFNVPIEVVENVFSYLPLTYLVNFLGASFDQAMHYSKNCTFESVKQELEDAEDAHSYMINHAGQVHLLKFRNLLLKNANTGFYVNRFS